MRVIVISAEIVISARKIRIVGEVSKPRLASE